MPAALSVALGVVSGERTEVGQVRLLVPFLPWGRSTCDIFDELNLTTLVIEETHGQGPRTGALGGAGRTDEGVRLLSLEAAREHEAWFEGRESKEGWIRSGVRQMRRERPGDMIVPRDQK